MTEDSTNAEIDMREPLRELASHLDRLEAPGAEIGDWVVPKTENGVTSMGYYALSAIGQACTSDCSCSSCHARIAINTRRAGSSARHKTCMPSLGVEPAGWEREDLRVLLLNTKKVVLRVVTVYSGNVSASLVGVGELFREAVRDNVTSVVLVHNHPSGDATGHAKCVVITRVGMEPLVQPSMATNGCAKGERTCSASGAVL